MAPKTTVRTVSIVADATDKYTMTLALDYSYRFCANATHRCYTNGLRSPIQSSLYLRLNGGSSTTSQSSALSSSPYTLRELTTSW